MQVNSNKIIVHIYWKPIINIAITVFQWKDDDKHFDFVESNRTALSSTDGASSSGAAPQVKIESLRDEWDEIEDEVFIGVF